MLNIKKVVSQLKKENYLAWQLKDGIHYITNRHYALALPALDPAILSALLVHMGGKQPEEGRTLHRWKKRDAEALDNGPNISSVCQQPQRIMRGEITKLRWDIDKGALRVVRFDGGRVVGAVNEIYADMLDKEVWDVIWTKDGDSAMQPIWLGNELMVLPFRVPHIKEDIQALVGVGGE